MGPKRAQLGLHPLDPKNQPRRATRFSDRADAVRVRAKNDLFGAKKAFLVQTLTNFGVACIARSDRDASYNPDCS